MSERPTKKTNIYNISVKETRFYDIAVEASSQEEATAKLSSLFPADTINTRRVFGIPKYMSSLEKLK